MKETFPQYQEAEQRKPENRSQFFRKEDFVGSSVLDLGCNAGEMLEQAKRFGAASTFGVEYDEQVVLPGRNILIADLDTVDWELIPESDVVMILAVTHWVKDAKRLVKEAEKKCKKVFYFEGHQQEYVKDNFNELFSDSQFTWEKLGETPVARPFYRGVRIV